MQQRAMRDRAVNWRSSFVTSGPGATNAVTALTDAYGLSSPCLYFWTSANSSNSTDAFQECDTIGKLHVLALSIIGQLKM